MKKIIFFLISILFILFFLGWYDVKNGRYSILGNYIPVNIKNFFKNTIFIIPNLQNQIVNQNDKITQLSIESTKTLETWKNIISSDLKMITATKITEETIVINDDEVIFRKFLLPLPSYANWGQKSVGYIEETNDKFLFVTGDGKIFFFYGNNISKNLANNKDKLKLPMDTNHFPRVDKEM